MLRIALVAAVFVPALASAQPQQLPEVCVAVAPVDAPCTSLRGRYRFVITPRDDGARCVVTKKLTGTLTVTRVQGEPRRAKPSFKLTSLRKPLGLTAAPKTELGAALRDGVCCLDLRVTGPMASSRRAKLTLNLAAGASKVGTRVRAEWSDDGGASCEDSLDAVVTKLK